jgi:hypothetical protein
MSDLSTIRVLWRQPDTLALWGIPYEMRPGQSPRDLWRARDAYVAPRPGHYGSKRVNLDDWIWLGQPGWFGSMSTERVTEVKAFIARHRADVPGNPYEWTTLPKENPMRTCRCENPISRGPIRPRISGPPAWIVQTHYRAEAADRARDRLVEAVAGQRASVKDMQLAAFRGRARVRSIQFFVRTRGDAEVMTQRLTDAGFKARFHPGRAAKDADLTDWDFSRPNPVANKNLLIGVGVAAVAVLGYAVYQSSKALGTAVGTSVGGAVGGGVASQGIVFPLATYDRFTDQDLYTMTAPDQAGHAFRTVYVQILDVNGNAHTVLLQGFSFNAQGAIGAWYGAPQKEVGPTEPTITIDASNVAGYSKDGQTWSVTPPVAGVGAVAQKLSLRREKIRNMGPSVVPVCFHTGNVGPHSDACPTYTVCQFGPNKV